MRIRTAIALAFAGTAMLPLGAYAGGDSHRGSSAMGEQHERHMGQSDDQRQDRGRHLGQKAGPNNPANRAEQEERNSSAGSSREEANEHQDRGRHLGQKAGPNNPANRADRDDRNSSTGSSSRIQPQPGASGGDSANSSSSGQFSGNASGAGSATASGQYSGSARDSR